MSFDKGMQERIKKKESIIIEDPYAYPRLKNRLSKVRRYKGDKLRIFYMLSTENPTAWQVLYDQTPQTHEVLFLYVSMRSDDTYKELYKKLEGLGLL